MTDCSHTNYVPSRWTDPVEGEKAVWLLGSREDTVVDLDTHRVKCTLCGSVLYNSTAAREFYEEGKTSKVLGLDKYPPADYPPRGL